MAVYPLRYQDQGNTVQVELSHAADVFIVDQANNSRRQRGQSFTYYGGHYRQSPVNINIPRAGTWFAVVEGSARASVSVISQ